MHLIDGGSKRRIYGAIEQLDRDMHSAFVGLEGSDGNVPSRAIYEVRCHRQRPWRYLAKRIREAREGDTPKEQTMEIVRVLELYVNKLYDRGSAA